MCVSGLQGVLAERTVFGLKRPRRLLACAVYQTVAVGRDRRIVRPRAGRRQLPLPD